MPAVTPVLSAANDETVAFSLVGTGSLDQALLQIDSDNTVPGATGTAKLMVKVDAAAQWVLEPTGVFAISANSSVVLRLPKYPYVKVVLVSTSNAGMLSTVYAR